MKELHEGIWGLHTRGCSLATKVVCADYYWPTLWANALDFTKKCRRCQEFADISCIPADNLHSLSFPWPFVVWGMNMLGPLPKAPRAIKYLLVAIDYFTKWIEGRPLREIMASEVEKFTWKHLMQVGPPIRHCHEQWHSIQSSNLRRLPNKARCQALCHLCRTSLDQRSGRGI